MPSLLNTWLKQDFELTDAFETEYMDITEIWNDFVDAWNEDFDWITGNLFGGTKVTLTKLEGVAINVPVSLNMPFFGDIDFWDFVHSVMWYKLTGNFTIFGFTVPVGVVGYWLLRGTRVPFFGTDTIFKLSQSEATKFGELNPGFTFKDLSYDMSKAWILMTLMKMLGSRGVSLLMQLVFQINRYRQPKMSDIIMRISPSGSSLKFDDDTELSSREELNYITNMIKEVLLYIIDPYKNPLPQASAVTTDEPDI